MVRALLVVPAVLAVLLFLLWAFQRHLIYLPSTAPVGAAGAAIPGARDVVLQTSDGLELGAWFVPAAEPDRGLAVLVANGNAGDRSGRAPLARKLAGHGLAVLLFDYRGYGGNPGSPSEDGLARDVRAARQYLVEETGTRPDQVLYYGESLGAAVVTELAAEHPPAGLVLRSPFVDLGTVGHVHYPFLPVRTLLRDRYPLVEQLAEVRVPVTVVYGTADAIVPPDQSRTVAEAAPELSQQVEIAGAGHNDPALVHGARLVRAVVALADQVRATP
jgi:pimeloyl-ACP methyl ester carboxylesterase